MTTAPRLPRLDADSFGGVIGWSIVAHLMILVIVPLTLRFFLQKHSFERPPTFQLVRLSPPAPAQRVAKEKAKVKPAEKTKPVPRDPKAKPVPKEQQKVVEEEDVDELAGLLDGMAKPAVDLSSVGQNFKYPWYLNNIRMKVEEQWKPAVENPDVYVDVSFTIFRDGGISALVIAHGSGIGSVDNLALRAIALAAPFGKLPVGFEGDRLDITYRLIPVRR